MFDLVDAKKININDSGVYIMLILQLVAIVLFILAVILLSVYLKKLDKYEKSIKTNLVGIFLPFLLVLALRSSKTVAFLCLIVFAIVDFILLLTNLGLIIAIAATPKPAKKQAALETATPPAPTTAPAVSVVVNLDNNTPKVEADDECASLAAISALALKTKSLEVTKKEIGQMFKKAQPKSVVKLRANYSKPAKGNSKGLLLPDTYSKKIKDKDVCFAYVYELDTKQVFLLLKIKNNDINELSKTYPTLKATNFPKPSKTTKWYRFFLDLEFVKNKQQIIDLLEAVYKLTK